jgi:low temperature requirement protein LtrA
VSGCLWRLGAVWLTQVRELVWALAVALDLLGATVGFSTAGRGRSRTWDWPIEGTHGAERCQALILLAWARRSS